jgi:hypothetical protein
MADVTLNRGNTVFNQREKENRHLLLPTRRNKIYPPKGNVTSRTAFKIMPSKIVSL